MVETGGQPSLADEAASFESRPIGVEMIYDHIAELWWEYSPVHWEESIRQMRESALLPEILLVISFRSEHVL